MLLQKSFAATKTLFVDVDEVVHGTGIWVVDDFLPLRIEAAEKIDFTLGVGRLPATQIAQIVFVHAENKVKSAIILGFDLPSHVTHRNAFTLHQFLAPFVRTVPDFCIDRGDERGEVVITKPDGCRSLGGEKQTGK